MTTILYHAHCPDGFAAAFAAWLKFGDAAQYIPVQYGQPPPAAVTGGQDGPSTVYILDFSYARETLFEIANSPGIDAVIVLDHHKTAEAELHSLPDPDEAMEYLVTARFDMEKSGAVLAWEYFHPDKPVPELFLYVQDRDLWQWRLDDSMQINTALWRGRRREFVLWKKILTEWRGPHDYHQNKAGLYFDGDVLLLSDETMLDTIARTPDAITGPGGELGLRVNSPVLQSELGERLLADNNLAEFADIWYERDGRRVHSLRSRPGGVDVSAIAARHGGGGHHSAAGYVEGASCAPVIPSATGGQDGPSTPHVTIP